MSKCITILGSTGTIGINTLDVIQQHPDRFKVFALTANKSIDLIFNQIQKFKPKYAVLVDESSADKLAKKVKKINVECKVLSGTNSLEWVCQQNEISMVMAAIVGAAGLLPTLAAVKAGKRILLANKEALVMSGQIFMDLVSENQVELLPIDSEHNAIYQSLPTKLNDIGANGIKDILLTASGGPFLNTDISKLKYITPKQAITHPNWTMGKKISVDSATMMNKGLEVIEACWLFNASNNLINVVIHPESIIHSMVRYDDGSVLAQMGNPDMRTPIAYSMAYPERISSGVEPLDLFEVGKLKFIEPDLNKFPCLRIAQEVAALGGTVSAIMNAANEIAVDAFLNNKIKYTDIPVMVEKTLEKTPSLNGMILENILKSDCEARENALSLINTL